MRIALKINVSSADGHSSSIPSLLHLLQEYKLQASFFYYPGRDDKNGGLVKKAAAIFGKSAKTQMNPEESMLAIVEAGHELGLLGGDEATWKKQAAFADEDWTAHQLALSVERFEQLTGFPPNAFAAPCWQINAHLLTLEQRTGFRYASDVRGKFPFLPMLHNVTGACPQIPTTLPTLSEALLEPGVDLSNVHEYLYAESRQLLPFGHVFSIDAESEAREYLHILEKLLVMWKGQEGFIRTLGDIQAELNPEELPVHQVGWAEVTGHKEHLATQSLKVEA